MPNNFARPVVAAARQANNSSIVLLRARALGNNCHHIADNFPGERPLRLVTPEELPNLRGITHVIRWGTTASFGGHRDAKVLNKASAIRETLNKAEFRLKAANAGLAPKTWMTLDALRDDPVGATAVIIRPREHARSEHIYKATNPAEAEDAIRRINGPYYISEFIDKDEEYRVFIVAGKAAIVLKKKPRNRREVSWGCVEEGALEVLRWSQWPMNVVENAIKAFALSKLDFGAVDVMVKGEKAYFLEINTAPEVWGYYGQRLGEAFHYHISRNNTERLTTTRFRDWKDTAHPTLLA